MGAYSPAPVMDEATTARAIDAIIRPTVALMAKRGLPFRGVLFAGLMVTEDGPKLIEYNVRFGDPETQALMMRLDGDLLDLLLATVEERLASAAVGWRPEPALTVVMAAKGYPGAYAKGEPIGGIEAAEAIGGVKVFHAGTAMKDGTLVSAGGRVLNVTAHGPTIAAAQEKAYRAIGRITWPGGFFRRDIGGRAVSRGGD
jgi:phosphoribosylamine--glycine ligase